MKLNISYQFELVFNEDQRILAFKTAGCCRYIWNNFLSLKTEKWEKNKESISRFELDKLLTKLKEEMPWLKEIPSQTLQQVNKDLNQAFQNFFRKSGYPNFKKKNANNSFRIPQGITLEKKISKKIGQVKLPKFGIVRFIQSREIKGTIRHITISKKCDKWFISFNCEIDEEIPKKKEINAIGIDRGVKKLAVMSDGSFLQEISPLKRNLKKIKKYQRSLKKKVKFSSNWKKIVKKLQKTYHHIKRKRQDYLHKVTTQLSKNHGLIVLEDLKVANMSKSAKGDKKNPGKNVKAKSGLNRSILDQGWHMFQTFLEYKMKRNGGKIIYVNPKNTSITCFECNNISKENRESQSKFKCTKCSYETNADLNASKNILAEGLSVMACGVETLVSVKKLELKMRKPVLLV